MSNELTAFLNFAFEKKQTETKVVEDYNISTALRWQLNWREYEKYLKGLGIDASSDARPSLLRYGNPQPDIRVLDDLIDFQGSLRDTILEIITDRRITPSNYKRFFSEANGVSTYLPLPKNLGHDITPENIGELNLHYDYDASTYRVFMSAVIRGMIVDKSIFNLYVDSEGKFHLVDNKHGKGKTSPTSDTHSGAGQLSPQAHFDLSPQDALSQQNQLFDPLDPARANGSQEGVLTVPVKNLEPGPSLVVTEGLLNALAATIAERLVNGGKLVPDLSSPQTNGQIAPTPEPQQDVSQDLSNVSLEEHEAYFSNSSKFVNSDDSDFICFPELSPGAAPAASPAASAALAPETSALNTSASSAPDQGFAAQALGDQSVSGDSQRELDFSAATASATSGPASPSPADLAESLKDHETLVQNILTEIDVISSANVAGFNLKLQEILDRTMPPATGDQTQNPTYQPTSFPNVTPTQAYPPLGDGGYPNPDSISFGSDASFENGDYVVQTVSHDPALADFEDEEPLLLEEVVYDYEETDGEEVFYPYAIEPPLQNQPVTFQVESPAISSAIAQTPSQPQSDAPSDIPSYAQNDAPSDTPSYPQNDAPSDAVIAQAQLPPLPLPLATQSNNHLGQNSPEPLVNPLTEPLTGPLLTPPAEPYPGLIIEESSPEPLDSKAPLFQNTAPPVIDSL
ncbi:MAG: hypothetical protein LBF38_01155, partial [Deltaproteobacteria bacterium]|nr:hypothetical protein [Deltaproteobacteria bacterium]